ncbi:unnamed protein product [Rhodiola kirilowii]
MESRVERRRRELSVERETQETLVYSNRSEELTWKLIGSDFRSWIYGLDQGSCLI